jgi:hypothetical protein
MSEDKPVAEKRLVEILKSMDLATNASVKAEIEKNRKIIVESRDSLLDTVHKRIDEVMERLDDIELDYVNRKEFEALKRQVERLQTP